ncbi:hypothetical protein QJS10_CPB20g02044 [Acorus calamus]|uniref:PORR domain-containing protein n=1 Tax=Acorus calamus TaxID=4465 RepID=A0AAV9C7K7_ACOCL|nr:hypothetical protein QJS10_CPB20g02044 [Acorus calamus]
MDSKLLHFTTNTPHTSLPFFLSCPSPSYLKRPTFSAPKALLSLPSNQLQRTPFWGTTLVSHETHLTEDKWRKTRLPFLPVRAAVKWRKERPLDNVIQRDKKLKLVLKIRSILVNQPDRIMNLKALGRYRKDLGLTRKRRFIALLKRFPGVFEIVEEGVYSLKFRLTPEAEKVYLEELRARNEMEDLLVVKLRKLLMMSLEKRILLEKIAHLKTDLGLPVEFRTTICERYPQYFKVVRTDRGPALELTHWDPALAVSAAEVNEEEKRVREMAERNLIIDRPLKFRRVKLPRGLNLSKGEMRRISMFREMPYISPYADFSHLRSGSNEKEKHACGVGLGSDVKKQEPESNVLLATIENMQYAVTVDHLHMVFSAFGQVQKIAMFEKNGGLQALIQFADVATAMVAKESLEGHCIYEGGFCKLHLTYSRHTDLSVKVNNDRGRDYTSPSGVTSSNQPSLLGQQPVATTPQYNGMMGPQPHVAGWNAGVGPMPHQPQTQFPSHNMYPASMRPEMNPMTQFPPGQGTQPPMRSSVPPPPYGGYRPAY